MIVPLPRPPFTLGPGVPPLEAGDAAALERCIGALAGRIDGAVVVRVSRTAAHRIVELATELGPLIVMERRGEPA